MDEAAKSQRAIIFFLWKEGAKPIEIAERLKNVFGDSAIKERAVYKLRIKELKRKLLLVAIVAASSIFGEYRMILKNQYSRHKQAILMKLLSHTAKCMCYQ